MEETNVTTGVEQVPAAGEQDQAGSEDSFDLESLLFGNDEEDTGANDEGAADPTEDAEQGKGQQQDQVLPDDASKAFAAKWAAESDKLEEKIRAKITQELEEKTRNSTQAQNQGAPTHRDPTPEELGKLAEDLKTSPEVARILYTQQQMIARQAEESKRNTQQSREQKDYSSAVQYARQLKESNPSMPDWDDNQIQQYRMEHYKQYGTTLPWKEAYKMQLADGLLNGNMTRQAQQEAIRKIQERDTAKAGPKAPSSSKKSINDLSKDQFEKMKEQALAGKYKRS